MLNPLIRLLLAFKTVIVTAVLAIGNVIVRFVFFRPTKERKRLAQLIIKKQKERNEEFSRLRSIYKFGSIQRKIVALNWDDLVSKLQTRELSAIQVLDAFIAKTLEISERCNPVTDFIPQATVWAKELDDLEVVKGPLHGIPFCVKDDTNVEGLDSTHGYAKWLYQPATESAVIVKVLQDLGAVPFCKTNVPQTLWSYGSDNPIFGITSNAHNSKLSAGGSSSGTGALVGAGGAHFGTGTDVGGSLRIPAHWNGVASIKPTSYRLSLKGSISPLPKLVGMSPSVGIIGQTPTIVATVVNKMVESQRQLDYDSMAIPIPWNSSDFESTSKLRIGYFTSLPYFPTMGDSGDIVLKAKEALESQGHTLVPFEMPDAYDYIRILVKISIADHSRHVKECWKDEEVADCVKFFWISTKIPVWIYKLVRKILLLKGMPFYSKRTAVFFNPSCRSSSDLWDAIAEKKELQDQILSQWNQLKLDAVICNVISVPAPPLNAPELPPSPYAVIWNLIDFPAGVVPMGSESGTKLRGFDDEGDLALQMAHKALRDSIGGAPPPIGIQIVGKPLKEEVVLRVMKELEPFNTFKSNVKLN